MIARIRRRYRGTPVAYTERVPGYLLQAAGLRVLGCDLTIVAARPRLAPALEAMRAAIAARLRVSPEAVNVKASTGNLAGMEGAGRGISAHAVALRETVG